MKLAIKGSLHGGTLIKQVFDDLGAQPSPYSCSLSGNIYMLNNENNITYDKTVDTQIYKVYEINDLLKEIKYRRGDKVFIECAAAIQPNLVAHVLKYVWSELTNRIEYIVFDETGEHWQLGANVLTPYTDDRKNNQDITVCDKKTDNPSKQMHEIDLSSFTAHKIKLELNDYEIKEINGSTYLVKKTGLPKTVEEAHAILYPESNIDMFTHHLAFYKHELMANFKKLLMCRDAYWATYNNWVPDWTDRNTKKYCITYYKGMLDCVEMASTNYVLAFPTIAMRDAFIDTFEELIVSCKELI